MAKKCAPRKTPGVRMRRMRSVFLKEKVDNPVRKMMSLEKKERMRPRKTRVLISTKGPSRAKAMRTPPKPKMLWAKKAREKAVAMRRFSISGEVRFLKT